MSSPKDINVNADADVEELLAFLERNLRIIKDLLPLDTAVSFDETVIAGETRMFLYDVDNATLERVTVGAADSGGIGFKVLRIPN